MCKHQEYDDFGQEVCLLSDKRCYDGDDCQAEEPGEYDVINGYFDDDPNGLRKWIWKNQGCPECKSINTEVEHNLYFTLYICKDCNNKEEVD